MKKITEAHHSQIAEPLPKLRKSSEHLDQKMFPSKSTTRPKADFSIEAVEEESEWNGISNC